MKKILIATGGTGGHIYPALVTAEELRRRGCAVRFIGVLGPAKAKLCASGFEYLIIRAKGFVSKSPLEMLMALGTLIKAFWACARDVVVFKPDVVIGFGGYSSFPTVLMACILGRKAMIHEQNVMPGEANKALAMFVRRIAVGFKDAMSAFPAQKTVFTGTPFRRLDISEDKDAALRHFGLEASKKTILVFGGSQGSRKINEVFLKAMELLVKEGPFQVIHATGATGLELCQKEYARLGVRAYVREFIDTIETAYAAADMVIARSGAGTITEIAHIGIPAVFIPYPGAQNHQAANARVLEQKQAGVIILEKDLSAPVLRDKIFMVLNSTISRDSVIQALKDDFPADPAVRLAGDIVRLADE
ncbi:MAG: undecaprenyldiphospho-muramoylpentapeptide beta-N-acetylglucosaminyltransferase [Candidatus Omnitrophica bacterium]|nr:undecaprenyldiphospho-muramoylpentapeptide beta-N-acetylglucosaminyltransferase [Candidatus Omnitrophota bacterium]